MSHKRIDDWYAVDPWGIPIEVYRVYSRCRRQRNRLLMLLLATVTAWVVREVL